VEGLIPPSPAHIWLNKQWFRVYNIHKCNGFVLPDYLLQDNEDGWLSVAEVAPIPSPPPRRRRHRHLHSPPHLPAPSPAPTPCSTAIAPGGSYCPASAPDASSIVCPRFIASTYSDAGWGCAYPLLLAIWSASDLTFRSQGTFASSHTRAVLPTHRRQQQEVCDIYACAPGPTWWAGWGTNYCWKHSCVSRLETGLIAERHGGNCGGTFIRTNEFMRYASHKKRRAADECKRGDRCVHNCSELCFHAYFL